MNNLVQRLKNSNSAGKLCDEAAKDIESLQAKLAKFQESEFHPDWSMLQATRELLKEYKAIIRELQAGLESIASNTCCDNCQEAKRVAEITLRPTRNAAGNLLL